LGITASFKTVYFTSTDTGWVGSLSPGQILRTTNGGTNWTVQYFANNTDIRSIYFSNRLTGYAVGVQNGVGLILKTTNRGAIWTQQISGVGYLLTSVYFRPNTDTGWTVGAGGIILKTTDGGSNWIVKNSGTTLLLTNISHPYPNRGWIGKAGNTLLYSTNSGETWTPQSVGISGDVWVSQSQICCNGVGWFSGSQSNGMILKTSNFGSNWIQQPITSNFNTSVFFYDVNTGWVAGYSVQTGAATMYNTTNGGSNWTSQLSTFYQEALYSVFFANNYTGYAVGQNGIILKTTNGGVVTGIHQTTSEIPEHFRLYQNYPNPFNVSSKIKFQMSKFSGVRIVIYDMLGKENETLLNEELSPGIYEVDFDGTNYPSGVYYYKLIAAEYTETKKMVLIK
jgi:photosystem II stability/assembly factor-like uncharacterized protein